MSITWKRNSESILGSFDESARQSAKDTDKWIDEIDDVLGKPT